MPGPIKGVWSSNITKYDSHARLMMRMRTVANSFTKTNRILTKDRKIHVMALDKATAEQHEIPWIDAPAYAQYPNIIFNVSAWPDLGKTSALVGLLGLNYHELSHIMFSPRGTFKQDLARKGRTWLFAYRILEDQRIESFFTALYEPAGKFFTETFIRFIMGDEDKWGRVFLYSYGRGFLPLDMRQEFEARFDRQDLVEEVKEIIDDYKSITLWDINKVNTKAYKTLQRMVRVINELATSDEDLPQCGGENQEDGEVASEQEKEARNKDRRRQSKEDRTGEDQSNFWDEDDDEETDEEADSGSGDSTDDVDGDGESDDEDSQGAADADESDDDEGESGPSGESDSDADSGAVGDDEGGESDSSSDSTSDSTSDSDSGESSRDSENESDNQGEPLDDDEEDDDPSWGGSGTVEAQYDDEELKDYLGEISEAIEEDQKVQDEVTRLQTAMNDNTNLDIIDFDSPQASHNDRQPASASWVAVEQSKKEFMRLWSDVEPGWRYGSDVGKLNIDRAIFDPDNYDEMFDEWDEGREIDTGLEVFILLDLSASMWGAEIQLASEAMWTLKYSLDQIEAKVTVLGFHENTVGLYDRNKMIGKMVPEWTSLGGDTKPAHGMKLARTVLSASTLPNKLFVVITDGGWSTYDEDGNRAVYTELLEAIPAVRMYVGVGGSGGNANGPAQTHCHVRTNVDNPMDIVPLVQKTVTTMIRERVER